MARENAFMILNQYFEDESFLNIALNEQLKKSNLKEKIKIYVQPLFMEQFKIFYIFNINFNLILKEKE
mgnify:FL=1